MQKLKQIIVLKPDFLMNFLCKKTIGTLDVLNVQTLIEIYYIFTSIIPSTVSFGASIYVTLYEIKLKYSILFKATHFCRTHHTPGKPHIKPRRLRSSL